MPTEEERTLALLAHVLQLVSSFIGPLVILVIKRQSRFVSFHALQALIWQATFACFGILAMIGCFIVIFTSGILGSAASHPKQPPIAFFVMFPLIWLFWMGGWVIGLVLAIVYGIKANRGEWAAYPVIGRWAMRLARG